MTTDAAIHLPWPPSLNGMYANYHNRGRIKTAPYKDWLNEAGWMLNQQSIPRFSGPVRIRYTFGPKKGRYDLSNFIKPIEDLLVTHRIIPDDNASVIKRFTVCQGENVDGVLVLISGLEQGEAA